jgi:hypothetical protein
MVNASPVPHISFEPAARWFTITALIVLAAYHFLLTVFTVLAFGLRYPFMDQFRLNLRYLTTPFPQNVLMLENGHRPVLPVASSIRMLSGELPPSLVLHEDGAELWFASPDGTLIGRASLTNSDAQPKNIFRLGIAAPGGFQGYVVQSDKPETLLARERDGVVKPLAHLELRE